MNFKEWCNSIGIEETRVVKGDMVSMTILKECWDYCQKENKQLMVNQIRLVKMMEVLCEFFDSGHLDANQDKALIEEIRENNT